MIERVLVVCIGNICRSPMAEALLRSQLGALSIRSAGISALVGHPADGIAIDLLGQRGIDLHHHRAHALTARMCSEADLILVMDRAQRRTVETMSVATRGKVFRLGEHGDFDIADPYRKSRAVFAACLDDIARGVDDWVRRIRTLD